MYALDEIDQLAASFPQTAPFARYFIEGDDAAVARELGARFWPSPERAYTNFLHAYAALFAIPPFVREALARQPDRFSRERLPHTIATTSGFILDAFGFDRRMSRPREVIYSPAPTIRASHSQRIDRLGNVGKHRISDAAMIYFGFHLLCAAETTAAASDERHFAYFRSFFREAGYRFPETRDAAEHFCARTDELMAGDEFAELWSNLLHAGAALQIDITVESLERFLLRKSAAGFNRWEKKRPSRD